MEVISLKAARALGLKWYFTGKPCKRGHVEERRVSDGHCPVCSQERARKARAANPEKYLERARKARAANPEKFRKRQRKAYADDPQKHQELARKYRAANLEKAREHARKHRAAPLGQLRGLCVHTAERLELGKLNHSRLKLLGYDRAAYMAHMESTLPVGMTFDEAREAGYQVDHIVPLGVIDDACPMDKAGRIVAFRMASDLENLQMLPGAENNSKNDSFDTPEQLRLFDVLCSRYLNDVST